MIRYLVLQRTISNPRRTWEAPIISVKIFDMITPMDNMDQAQEIADDQFPGWDVLCGTSHDPTNEIEITPYGFSWKQ